MRKGMGGGKGSYLGHQRVSLGKGEGVKSILSDVAMPRSRWLTSMIFREVFFSVKSWSENNKRFKWLENGRKGARGKLRSWQY